ncbi:virulence factor family protein [Aureimonas sp. AU4]|uniref:virulence factor family protein n=1 Tax=Aureimonas sp. AU4 TaxID=1638163 RepID=UPI00078198BE|nr:AcvB/VirJ family lysyl-phosphatidylglycerol hydrolase [Aureimonas sp. AU4]
MNRIALVLTSLGAVILAGAATGALVMRAVGTDTAEAVPATTVSYENMTNVPVLSPDGEATGLAVLISDGGGLTAADRSLAADLVDSGLIVLPVDLDRWRAGVEAEIEAGDDCIYLGSDLEGIAKEALRALQLDTYFHPVVIGRGEGGTMAYAAVADAPAATLAGGVAIQPSDTARSRLPVCEGAKATPEGHNTFSYDRTAELPQPFTFVLDSGTPAPTPLTGTLHAGTEIGTDAGERQDAGVEAAVKIAEADNSALPIVVGKPKGDPVATVIFFSGDGGWRDLDKTIGDWLTEHGVEVIGVDSLRYFWSEKTPEQMASDIGDMLADAKPKPGIPVALMGYSFGADTLPFAYGFLPQTLRDRVTLVGLLAPSLQTGFQISVGGWLGMSTGDRGVVASAASIPAAKVLCVYGTEETDTACLDPKLAGVTKLPIDGGHHFDGNYDAMAERILAALKGGPQAAVTATVTATTP